MHPERMLAGDHETRCIPPAHRKERDEQGTASPDSAWPHIIFGRATGQISGLMSQPPKFPVTVIVVTGWGKITSVILFLLIELGLQRDPRFLHDFPFGFATAIHTRAPNGEASILHAFHTNITTRRNRLNASRAKLAGDHETRCIPPAHRRERDERGTVSPDSARLFTALSGPPAGLS